MSTPKFSPDRLLAARNRTGLSREKVAVAAGVPYGSLQRYERGHSDDPPFNAMARVAQVLGITVSDLVEPS